MDGAPSLLIVAACASATPPACPPAPLWPGDAEAEGAVIVEAVVEGEGEEGAVEGRAVVLARLALLASVSSLIWSLSVWDMSSFPGKEVSKGEGGVREG